MGPLSWMRVAPRPRREASAWMVTGFLLSKYWSEPADVIACLMLSTADWCSGPHWKSLLFLVRSHRLADREATLGTNRLRNCVMPRIAGQQGLKRCPSSKLLPSFAGPY